MTPSYVMDVCSTCGRHAVWPYCEHKGAEKWTEPVVVRPVTDRGRALCALWIGSHRSTAA
jgi:hypothetical protein